ncbi:MAG: AAA family ATPase [Actinomycetes bacterium]
MNLPMPEQNAIVYVDDGYPVEEAAATWGVPVDRLRVLLSVRQAPADVPADAATNSAVSVPEPRQDEAPTAQRTAATEEPTETWQPIDLAPYLRGDRTRPEPSVGLRRADGLRLLYPGKEHTVIGEMESGKSWFASACAVAELTQRRHVVYVHFEESDPLDTVERLRALGVGADDILARFRFVGPEEPVTPDGLARLVEPAPSLVVLDGVNEAMSLHGLGIRDEDGAAAFRRLLVRPFIRAGAATLAADHVVKDRERRDRSPLGSIHKGNGLTGCMVMLENVEPYGRGLRGRSHVFVTKDRPGYLRRRGRPMNLPGKTFMGELVVDDTRTVVGYLDLTLWAPREDVADAEPSPHSGEAVDAHVLDVVRALHDDGQQVNTRRVYAKSKFGKEKTGSALERLVLDGQVCETSGTHGARLFTLPPGPSVRSCVPAPKEGGRERNTGTDGPAVPGTFPEQTGTDGTVLSPLPPRPALTTRRQKGRW